MKFLVPTLVIVIIFLAAGLSYLMGKSTVDDQKSAATTSKAPTQELAATLTPTETPTNSKKVTGGGVLSFPGYELTVPLDWTDSKESQTKDDEKVTIKKGSYQITVQQGGFGGVICLFPGDSEVEGPSVKYDSFKQLTTINNDKFRRSWTGEENTSKGFAICQLNEYGWQAPTLYGHISFITPGGNDTTTLSEMDNILSSLVKK